MKTTKENTIQLPEDVHLALRQMFDTAVGEGSYTDDQPGAFQQFAIDTLLLGVVIQAKVQAKQIDPEVFNHLESIEIIDKQQVCLN